MVGIVEIGIALAVAILMYAVIQKLMDDQKKMEGNASKYTSKDVGKKKWKKPLEMKDYTEDEVANHNRQDDVWLIIDGNVYDVTSYVDEHPGGLDILKNAGKDSSKGFHGEQHGDAVLALVEDYRIGQIKNK